MRNSAVLWAGQDQTPHPLAEGDVPGELPELVVEAVHVGLRPTARRLEVRAAPGVRLAGVDVNFPEAAGPGLLARFGPRERRDHEVAEPLGVEDRGSVRLVLIHD